MKDSTTSANKRRAINKEELKRYLSERGKLSHIFDNLEKLEDLSTEMDSATVSRLNSANSTRLALLKNTFQMKSLLNSRTLTVKHLNQTVNGQ